jgi:NAD(P)-dependent dehydrogenase (short-subunit alcohol dehydrogenase family)
MPMPERVVMITGAAGALGRAAAESFARSGAALVLLDADGAALRSAHAAPSLNTLLVPTDLLDEAQVRNAADAAMSAFGRVDVLCNIAGGFYYGEPVHQTRHDIWLQQFQLNATTVVNASKAVVPHMLSQGSGCVLNIGAAAHMQGHAHMSAYAAAKSAVMRLTESMAEELRDTGVSVLCLMPTIIDTPKNRLDMPQADHSQWTPSSAIADLLVLLSSDAAALMSGCSIPLTGRARSVALDTGHSS